MSELVLKAVQTGAIKQAVAEYSISGYGSSREDDIEYRVMVNAIERHAGKDHVICDKRMVEFINKWGSKYIEAMRLKFSDI